MILSKVINYHNPKKKPTDISFKKKIRICYLKGLVIESKEMKLKDLKKMLPTVEDIDSNNILKNVIKSSSTKDTFLLE
jgi:hypothetical protein